ncbi:MAG: hypothetical protein ACTHLF_09190, partial [Luteibacter sp.]
LGLALAAHPNDVEQALREFEHAMFVRSAKSAGQGVGFYEILASEDPARGLIGMLDEGVAAS